MYYYVLVFFSCNSLGLSVLLWNNKKPSEEPQRTSAPIKTEYTTTATPRRTTTPITEPPDAAQEAMNETLRGLSNMGLSKNSFGDTIVCSVNDPTKTNNVNKYVFSGIECNCPDGAKNLCICDKILVKYANTDAAKEKYKNKLDKYISIDCAGFKLSNEELN